jgi:hypothetical protein
VLMALMGGAMHTPEEIVEVVEELI